MKGYILATTASFLLFVLSGCQKDLKESTINKSVQNNIKVDNGNVIRLTSLSSEYGNETYQYNENGLVQTWTLSQIGAVINHEYDDNGRLTRAWVYFNGTLTYTIDFFYEHNRVVRELWYEGNTTTINDEVLYTFVNNVPAYSESPVQGYRIDYKFSNEGNFLEFLFSVGGIVFVKVAYTYDHHLKSPFSAIPGLTYNYLSAGGFFNANKWYSTSESFTLYDEQGNVLMEFPQDPSKTIVEAGPQNFVSKSDFYDIPAGEFVHFVFNYENCGGCEGHKNPVAQSAKSSIKSLVQELLFKASKKSLNERANAVRQRALR